MHSFDGRSPVLAGGLAAVLALVLSSSADAQMFSYGGERPRNIQSLSLAYKLVDFNADGAALDERRFEFAGPAYGAFYARPSLTASVTYGPRSEDASRDLRLLDAAITTWGEVLLTGSPATARLFVPIAIQSNYRRVAPRGSEHSLIDSFNLTVLALGAGLGYASDLARRVRFEFRATPMIGLALRAFGDSTGISYLIDADLRIHVLDLAGRIGLTAGYGFRAQTWNVDGSNVLLGLEEDLFDYSGAQHLITVGMNW